MVQDVEELEPQLNPLVLGDPRGPIAVEFARIGGAVRRWLAERDQELGQAA